MVAEFCLDCWNKLNGTKDLKWRYVRTWRKDFCEECEEYKKVIVVERRWSRIQKQISETMIYLANKRK